MAGTGPKVNPFVELPGAAPERGVAPLGAARYTHRPMLDIKLLRDDPDRIGRTLVERHAAVFDDLGKDAAGASAAVERLVELDREYREAVQAVESCRHQQKENTTAMKAVSKLPKDEQASARQPLIDHGRALREREHSLDLRQQTLLEQRDAAWRRVPNLTHPDSPRGHTDDDHAELRREGERRDFGAEGFEPRDHLTIGEELGLIDFHAGAKVAGQKFYFLQREAVMLDLALQPYALSIAAKHGFRLHTTPDLARAEIVDGLGFNPRGESTQIYSIADSDLCLVGTAEITLGGMMADHIFTAEELPLLVAGLSHCFRTEAGSHGKESRGLYRVHQFTKVELFAFVAGDLEISETMHERVLAVEEEIWRGLGIPYRVVDIASGDLGGQAYRKFDLEAWMPGRGEWGEITSASNCTDYQARRLRIRWRPDAVDGKKQKPRPVHMLNGTAIAISRAIVAILENYQRADGGVDVPEVLRPWVGCDVIGPR
jgi:seryl-tRNA synthetase